MDIPLTSGAYSAQGLIANAQRSINVYPEKNPADTTPAKPVTHYPRPGLTLLGAPPVPAQARGLYATTNGLPLAVVGQNVYFIDQEFKFNLLGTLIQAGVTNPVRMSDNGKTAVLVDGSSNGYQITINPGPPNAFLQIGDPNFLGANWVDFLDGFLVFNQPNTRFFYATLANQVVFNALYVGETTAYPDNCIAVICNGRELWVIGPRKAEVWYNAGTVPFPFQLEPGVIIEQGCIAQYSVAKMDTNIYWVSQSPEGARMVMRLNTNHVAQRISTHAIEFEWLSYPRVDDAIGATYQISGHSFYKIHFPTADKTWGFDEATQQWHEDNWIDGNGVLHRARNTFCCYAYGMNMGLDWQNGNLYKIDPAAYTDNGQVIAWKRSFPHVVKELTKISGSAFVADIETGAHPGSDEGDQFTSPWSQGFSSGFGPLGKLSRPTIAMRVSKNGGYSFGNHRLKGLVSSGHYRSMERWRQLGIGRDWVFELSSTADMVGIFNGAFFTPIETIS